jgi:hypothetical protein
MAHRRVANAHGFVRLNGPRTPARLRSRRLRTHTRALPCVPQRTRLTATRASRRSPRGNGGGPQGIGCARSYFADRTANPAPYLNVSMASLSVAEHTVVMLSGKSAKARSAFVRRRPAGSVDPQSPAVAGAAQVGPQGGGSAAQARALPQRLRAAHWPSAGGEHRRGAVGDGRSGVRWDGRLRCVRCGGAAKRIPSAHARALCRVPPPFARIESPPLAELTCPPPDPLRKSTLEYPRVPSSTLEYPPRSSTGPQAPSPCVHACLAGRAMVPFRAPSHVCALHCVCLLS